MPTAAKLQWPQGQPLFEVQWRAVAESLAGNGVRSASDLEVTATATDLEIQVASGTAYYLASESTLGAAETHTLSAGPTTTTTVNGSEVEDERWDTVYLDTSTESSGVREGTPAPDPEPPDVQGDELLLAVVYVPHAATDVPDSDVLNWRAQFSNEAEEIHYDDPEGFFGQDSVAGALNDANDVLVRRDYPTNSGALVLTDMPVDGNAAAGTEQSFTWAIDAEAFLTVYAESDGAGGIQAQALRVPPGREVYLGDPNTDNGIGLWHQRNIGGTTHELNRFLNGAGEYIERYIAGNTNTSQRKVLANGDWEIDFGIALASGETLLDYANARVPAPRRTDMETEDLTAGSGGTTIWNYAAGHVPRPQVDDRLGTITVTSSTYTTSDEEVVFVDTTTIGAASTITLASADAEGGNVVRIVDLTGDAANYNITVETEGTETIDGGSTSTVNDKYGSAILTSDGTNWAVTGGTAAGTEVAQQMEGAETGAVAAGDQGVLIVDHLADGEKVRVQKAVLTTATVEAVTSGVNLELVTFDNAGGYTVRETLISGDGSTVHDNETGSPLASYTNGTGSGQSVGVLVDNTTSGSVDIVAKVAGDIV